MYTMLCVVCCVYHMLMLMLIVVLFVLPFVLYLCCTARGECSSGYGGGKKGKIVGYQKYPTNYKKVAVKAVPYPVKVPYKVPVKKSPPKKKSTTKEKSTTKKTKKRS